MWPPQLNDPVNKQKSTIALSIFALLIIVVGFFLLIRWDLQRSNNSAPITTSTALMNTQNQDNLSTLPTTSTSTTQPKSSTTTTTALPSWAKEGSFESVSRLQSVCNVENSQLSPDAYEQIRKTAIAAFEARAIGKGASSFQTYLANSSPMSVEMAHVNVMYACAFTFTPNPNYMRATVLWSGTRKDGQPVKQAKSAIYFNKSTLQPVGDRLLSSPMKDDAEVHGVIYG